MRPRFTVWICCVAGLLASCERTPQTAKLTVAAAANLTDVFADVGRAFHAQTGIEAVFSYGSTAQLAQQIDSGAPFDLFAAADTEHVDSLVTAGKLMAGSRAVYATGQLALWSPHDEQAGLHNLQDLASPEVHFIAIAQPELAPYGQAAVEALQHAGLWDVLKPKIVYANSISQARQWAESGNADAAFTAYSLVLHDPGTIVKVEAALYSPLEQSLAIVANSPQNELANRFRSFLLGPEGRTILAAHGYLLP